MTKEDFLSGKTFSINGAILDTFKYRKPAKEYKFDQGDIVFVTHHYRLSDIPKEGLYAATIEEMSDHGVTVYGKFISTLVHLEIKFENCNLIE